MAKSPSLYNEYVLTKGPLNDQEKLLTEFLLRDTYYKPGMSVGASTGGAAQAPGNPNSPPIRVPTTGSGLEIPYLSEVGAGDLITAAFMNGIVSTVNAIIEGLSVSTNTNPPAPSAAPTTPAAPATAGIWVALKDVQVSVADTDDNITVTFPADKTKPEDFSDILVGNRRIDPGDLVKTATGYSFKINKDVYTTGSDVRAVAKAGATAQGVMSLFK